MIVELLINGIVEGSLLALICIGYSLAYGSAKVINFAHADAMVAGGGYLVLIWIAGNAAPELAKSFMPVLFGMAPAIVVMFWLRERRYFSFASYLAVGAVFIVAAATVRLLTGRLSFFFASLLAIPMTAFLTTAVYYAAYRGLLRRDSPRTSVLLASLGMSIAIQSCLLILWKTERRVFPADVVPSALRVRTISERIDSWHEKLHFGIFSITEHIWLPIHDLLILAVFVVVAIALFFFFRFSRLADAIVATADSRLAARSCGVPVDRIVGWAFFLGGAIASLGGTLYVLRAKSLHPQAGFTVGIIAFVACVLGGIGSLRGSIMGAFLISLVISFAPVVPLESWASTVLPDKWLHVLPSLNLADWSYGVAYALMIITILFKPQGIFAR